MGKDIRGIRRGHARAVDPSAAKLPNQLRDNSPVLCSSHNRNGSISPVEVEANLTSLDCFVSKIMPVILDTAASCCLMNNDFLRI